MKLKLTPSLCYIAGLQSKSRETAMSAVGIVTTNEELEQRFASVAVKELGVKPEKILIESKGSARHVYFYHSLVSRQAKKIIEDQLHYFKSRNELSANYVAGMFDATGYVSKMGIGIRRMTPADEVMLSHLGIVVRNGRFANGNEFISFIKDHSTLIKFLNLSSAN